MRRHCLSGLANPDIYVSLLLSPLPLSSSCSYISIWCTPIGKRLIRMWPGHKSIPFAPQQTVMPAIVYSWLWVFSVWPICTLNCLCGTFSGVCLMDCDDSHLSSPSRHLLYVWNRDPVIERVCVSSELAFWRFNKVLLLKIVKIWHESTKLWYRIAWWQIMAPFGVEVVTGFFAVLQWITLHQWPRLTGYYCKSKVYFFILLKSSTPKVKGEGKSKARGKEVFNMFVQSKTINTTDTTRQLIKSYE